MDEFPTEVFSLKTIQESYNKVYRFDFDKFKQVVLNCEVSENVSNFLIEKAIEDADYCDLDNTIDVFECGCLMGKLLRENPEYNSELIEISNSVKNLDKLPVIKRSKS